MPDIAKLLAEHVVHFPAEKIPADIKQYLSRNLADGIAATLGGSRAEGIAALTGLLQQQFKAGSARVVNSALNLPAVAAAQVNASAGHALDYDDTLDAGGGMHAGALVHNAVLAVADELGNVSGEEYLTAVALGLDVAVRLALAPTEDFGWHRTAVFGIFGVVAAVGRLLKLDEHQLLHAFGIAYSQASGNRQCVDDGALSKRLQAGFAARNGITAVQLAKAGLTGAINVFEGNDGFFRLYQRGQIEKNIITDGLGETLLSSQISLKPYPCGRNLHGILDATFRAKTQHQQRDITAVRVYLHERSFKRLRKTYPQHVVEAQFSIPFSIALATFTGKTSLQDYDFPLQASDDVKQFSEKVTLHSHSGTAKEDWLEFIYADGSVQRENTADKPFYGHPLQPLSDQAIQQKLADCNQFAGSPLTESQLATLFNQILTVNQLDSTTTLTALLQPGQ